MFIIGSKNKVCVLLKFHLLALVLIKMYKLARNSRLSCKSHVKVQLLCCSHPFPAIAVFDNSLNKESKVLQKRKKTSAITFSRAKQRRYKRDVLCMWLQDKQVFIVIYSEVQFTSQC